MSNAASISVNKKTAFSTRQLVSLAMICAVSYVVMWLSKLIPISIGFLQFDFKDMVIAIGGFLFGPLPAVAVSVVVSTIEMLTASDTGPVGLLMNVLATCAFVCPAAYLYKRNHTFNNAVIGLVVGSILMTITMVLWNYIITPLYYGWPREEVVGIIVPMLLPFNILKAGMNTVLTILLYKPVVTVLRKVHIVAEQRDDGDKPKTKWGAVLLGVVVLTTCVLLGLVIAGVI